MRIRGTVVGLAAFAVVAVSPASAGADETRDCGLGDAVSVIGPTWPAGAGGSARLLVRATASDGSAIVVLDTQVSSPDGGTTATPHQAATGGGSAWTQHDLRPGATYRLEVFGSFGLHTCGQSFTIVVPSGPPPPPAPPPGPKPATYTWNFESLANLPGCAERGLSCPGLAGWDVPQWPEMRNGQTRAVRPEDYGVPPLPGASGARVLRASVDERQRDDGAYAAYLYKVWAVGAPETGWSSDLTNRPLERIRPGQEAGTYRAWYYLPGSTRTTLQHNNDASHGWVNIFQFKHSGPNMDGPGKWNQPPEWWVNIRNNDPNHLTLAVSHWGDPAWGERRGNMPAVPFGRWFELRADVHPGDRIDFFLDGQPFETGRQRDHPVGLQPGDSSWIFSTGYYLNTGTAYIDDVTFARPGAVAAGRRVLPGKKSAREKLVCVKVRRTRRAKRRPTPPGCPNIRPVPR